MIVLENIFAVIKEAGTDDKETLCFAQGHQVAVDISHLEGARRTSVEPIDLRIIQSLEEWKEHKTLSRGAEIWGSLSLSDREALRTHLAGLPKKTEAIDPDNGLPV